MAQYTPAQLVAASDATYTSNDANQITAALVRSLNNNWISSSALVNNSNAFTGSQVISGNLTVINGSITGSLNGTATTASFVQTASFTTTSATASFVTPLTQSFIVTGSANILGPLTSSLAATINGLYVGKGKLQTSSNTVLGEGAYQGPDGGTNNTAIGFGALAVSSGSIRNTAVGAGALAAAIDDTDNNIAVGYQALNKLDGGTRNVAIGNDALFSSLANDSNTAIGHSAGVNSIGGDENVYVGFEAGADNEGNYNTFIGAEAGEKLASGNNNILIGRRVAFNMVTGSNNIIIGSTSTAFISGSDNVIIGQAPSNSSSFSNNIIISDGQGDIRARYIYINNASGSWVFDGSLQVTGSEGNLIVHGHKQFNYGAFYNTASITLTANTSQSLTFTTTDEASGVTLSNNSRLNVTNAGVYNLQFSAQLNQGANSANYYIWLKKNGSNVANTAGKDTLASNHSDITSWNYVLTLAANDYLEIAIQSDANNSSVAYIAASGNIPAAPSVIATVTQVR